MGKLQRRKFTKAAVGGMAATAAVTTMAAPAISQHRQEWRMVTSWPKMFPGGGTAAERFAKTIGEATGGRLTIKVFGGRRAGARLRGVRRRAARHRRLHAFDALLLAEQGQDPQPLHHRAVRHDEQRNGGMAALRRRPGAVGRDLCPVRPEGVPCRLDQRADGRLVQPRDQVGRRRQRPQDAHPRPGRRGAAQARRDHRQPAGGRDLRRPAVRRHRRHRVGRPVAGSRRRLLQGHQVLLLAGHARARDDQRDHRQQGEVGHPAQGRPADLRVGLRRRACRRSPPRTTPTTPVRSRR